MRLNLIITFLLISCTLFAHGDDPMEPKKLIAKRSNLENIKIDADLSDPAWLKAPIAEGFVQLDPMPGDAASHDSQIRLLYDDKAIYVSALLKDNNPDSIYTQYSERDDVGVVDWFGITLDTYQDGQNAVGFFVTAAGVQVDMKYSEGAFGDSDPMDSGDESWDAVWESVVKITEEGWAVEFKIPYSALRFAQAEIQNWNINFSRMIRRYREVSFWNPIDPKGNGFMVQSGVLEGLENIKSPLRLSATPFLAGYAQIVKDPASDPAKSVGQSFNGGMDIKYGINEAFTLDMTLIPDFGEARSDQQVLNLSPFEVRFNENRQFFTEGVELFDKLGLFYSRRVGGTAIDTEDLEDQLSDDEVIEKNPARTKLLNATKVSGRTKSGLGIGVFNAVEAFSFAEIRNMETNELRNIQTSPLTNYNVVVFNQNLKNNSSASIINTNVMRSGTAYDANVTGAELSLNNKKNTYRFGISGARNVKYYTDRNETGHTFGFSGGKTAGKLNWSLGYNEESETYDPNDLGFLFNNNSRGVFGNVSFAQFEQFGPFTAGRVNLNVNYQRLYKPDEYMWLQLNLFSFLRTKNFFAFGAFANGRPFASHNYYDTRSEDFSQYIEFPAYGSGGMWFSTDYRKKIATDVEVYFGGNKGFQGRYYGISLYPRFQINDRVLIRPRLGLDFGRNDPQYVETLDDDTIIFGMVDQNTWVNELELSYIFGPKMSLALNGRHYWSKVKYLSFWDLGDKGSLLDSSYDTFNDINFNAFNIDTVFRWRFAPGSDIFFVWKNNISSFDNIKLPTYGENFEILRDSPTLNSFSLKIIYFLDYLAVTKKG